MPRELAVELRGAGVADAAEILDDLLDRVAPIEPVAYGFLLKLRGESDSPYRPSKQNRTFEGLRWWGKSKLPLDSLAVFRLAYFP